MRKRPAVVHNYLIAPAIFLLIVFLRLPSIFKPFFNLDEGIFALMGQGILEGKVIYRDIVDMCAPIVPFIYAWIFKMFGPYNMTAVHASLLLVVSALAWLIYYYARLSGNSRFAYVGSVFFVVFSYTYHFADVLAFETEWVQAFFLILGMCCLLKSRGSPRTFWMLLSGVSFGVSFYAKGSALIVYAGVLFTYSMLSLWEGVKIKALIGGIIASIAGFLSVFFLGLGFFLYKGALSEMYFWSLRYPARYYVPAIGWNEKIHLAWRQLWLPHSFLRSNWLLISLFFLFAVRLVWAAWKCGESKEKKEGLFLDWLLAAWALFSYAAIAVSGRFFGHYFIILLPPLCLACGRLIQGFFQGGESLGKTGKMRNFIFIFRSLLIAVIITGIVFPLSRYSFRWKEWRFVFSAENRIPPGMPPEIMDLARYIRETSGKDDSIFVWGFYPEIYALSQRRSASSYINCNFLTGLIPWTNHAANVDTSKTIVPGAWAQLMGELRMNRPLYIVDTSVRNHRGYKKYPLTKFIQLHDFIDNGYRVEKEFFLSNGNLSLRLYRKKG